MAAVLSTSCFSPSHSTVDGRNLIDLFHVKPFHYSRTFFLGFLYLFGHSHAISLNHFVPQTPSWFAFSSTNSDGELKSRNAWCHVLYKGWHKLRTTSYVAPNPTTPISIHS